MNSPPPSAPADSLPEKKQKVDDDDDASWASFGSDADMIPPSEWKEVSNDEEYDSEEEYCPNYPHQKHRDHAVWDKYYRQIEESEGFDIKDYPGSCMMANIYPMQCYLKDPKNYDKVKGYAERALELYNHREGTNYAVVKVLKVNGGGCRYFNFYITFSVVTRDGKGDWFLAKVVKDIGDSVEFSIIRPRPKKDLDILFMESALGPKVLVLNTKL